MTLCTHHLHVNTHISRFRCVTSQRQMEIMASPPVVYVVVTQYSNQARGIWRISPMLRIAPAPPCMEKVCVGVLGMPHLPLAPLNSTPAKDRCEVVLHQQCSTGSLFNAGIDMDTSYLQRIMPVYIAFGRWACELSET